jgi:hypothetical protein
VEEILRFGSRILRQDRRFHCVRHGNETRGGKARVKPPERSDKLGL